MASLQEQLRQFAERAGQRAETVTRAACLQMANGMVMRSPVDTGRFRGAWVYGAGAKSAEQPQTLDKAGGASLTCIAAGLQAWQAGQAIYITNNLPYGPRLEHGWSKQAPAGFVRITVSEFAQHVAEAIRSAT